MIFFIITTSVYNNCSIRKMQYIYGITALQKKIQDFEIKDYKMIVVENNGKRHTFLDDLENCEVYYTENNFLPTNNKGFKELCDIFNCIDHFKIQDSDFVVKMTGRYILDDTNGEFMNRVRDIHHKHHDYKCVIKYGSYRKPVNYKMDDCITGLIGMSCCYMKQIELPLENDCVEWNWGKVTRLIDDEKINILRSDKLLGIHIRPESNSQYFIV